MTVLKMSRLPVDLTLNRGESCLSLNMTFNFVSNILEEFKLNSYRTETAEGL
jgi:hypothetical protein